MPTVLDSLTAALHRAFAADPTVILLGEDVMDPYGGAFKVTRGLSTAYPERVLAAPVSEAGMVGVAAGMALRGLRPVVEIMFGDFITLAADQLINSAAKFRSMYGGDVSVPLVVRTPMGGRRGYGPTHSQTLEKLFLGIPGLRVLAPTALGDPEQLLYFAILGTQDPLIFIENKLLYLAPLFAPAGQEDLMVQAVGFPDTPAYRVQVNGAPPPGLTITAYGYMAELSRQAMLQLAYEAEIFCELVVPTALSPADHEPILASVSATGKLLTVEEGAGPFGWGATVIAAAAEALGPRLCTARHLNAADRPVPAALPLEEAALPGTEAILRAVKMMV